MNKLHQIARGLFLILIFGVHNRLYFQDCSPKIQKGTLIIAAVGSDGILIVADSRLTTALETTKGPQIESYKDRCQKIFIVKGVPIANSGYFNFYGHSFPEIIQRYNLISQVTPESFIDVSIDLAASFSLNFPTSKFDEKNVVISGGYRNDTGFILLLKNKEISIRSHLFRLSDSLALPFLKRNIPKNDKDTLLTCKQLQKILEKTFKDYMATRITVGGPVSIIKINKDNTYTWVKNDFSSNPEGETKPHVIGITDTAKWNKELRMF